MASRFRYLWSVDDLKAYINNWEGKNVAAHSITWMVT